ncbi:MAG: DUF4232 domain-containing protein [Actinomycetes bacterium]
MTMRARLGIVGASAGLLTLGLIAGSPAAFAGDSSVATCSARDLSARQSGSGAGMSQPYVQITLTNTSGVACALDGYPKITGAWTRTGRKAVKVSNRNLQNIAGPAPHRFIVPAGGHAWFAIGTATAYDPPLVTFRRFAFATTAGSSLLQRRTVAVQLQATAPSGKPFPVGVTAFAPGSHP